MGRFGVGGVKRIGFVVEVIVGVGVEGEFGGDDIE